MKLRNKKTGGRYTLGEDIHIAHTGNGSIEVEIVLESGGVAREYFNSLAEFNDEWEDVKEPLIKDPKIRKAVRAWAEANGVNRAILGQVNNDELVKKSPMTNYGCHISFEGNLGLERGRNYTIEELCGEDEQYAIEELCGEDEQWIL